MFLPEMTIAGDDIFLSALFGGILSGVGTGILFAVHATTGGDGYARSPAPSEDPSIFSISDHAGS